MEITMHNYTKFLIKTDNMKFIKYTSMKWDYYVDSWYKIVTIDEAIEIMKLYSDYALKIRIME